MRSALFVPTLRLMLGLLSLLCLGEQAIAAASQTAYKTSAYTEVNFGRGSFMQQNWACKDCNVFVPEKSFLGNTQTHARIGAGVPEKFGNSDAFLVSVFDTNRHEVFHGHAGADFFGDMQKHEQQWGHSFVKPRDVFGNTTSWAHHERDEELYEGLTGWNDDVHVDPIPEAEEWMMMLMGFGVLGWVTNRRKHNAPSGVIHDALKIV